VSVVEGNRAVDDGSPFGARVVVASVRASVVAALNRVVVRQVAVGQDGTVLSDGSMNNARMKNGRVFGASIALAGVRAAVVTSVVRHYIRNSLVKS
jgi:hypothetical protein